MEKKIRDFMQNIDFPYIELVEGILTTISVSEANCWNVDFRMEYMNTYCGETEFCFYIQKGLGDRIDVIWKPSMLNIIYFHFIFFENNFKLEKISIAVDTGIDGDIVEGIPTYEKWKEEAKKLGIKVDECNLWDIDPSREDQGE